MTRVSTLASRDGVETEVERCKRIQAERAEERATILALFVGDRELYSVDVAKVIGRRVEWTADVLRTLEAAGELTSRRVGPGEMGCKSGTGRRYYKRAGVK